MVDQELQSWQTIVATGFANIKEIAYLPILELILCGSVLTVSWVQMSFALFSVLSVMNKMSSILWFHISRVRLLRFYQFIKLERWLSPINFMLDTVYSLQYMAHSFRGELKKKLHLLIIQLGEIFIFKISPWWGLGMKLNSFYRGNGKLSKMPIMQD